MKSSIIVFLMLVSLAAVAQKKKDKDGPSPEQAQIDTLTRTNAALVASNEALTGKSDSLSKELDKYLGLYTVIKDKVVKMDFDPAKMGTIIDSLQAGRQTLALEAAAGAMLTDSIRKLNMVGDSLMKENQGLLYTVNLLRGQPAVSPSDPKEFIGTWNLVLRKVKIEGQPPRAGIIDISDVPLAKTAAPLESNPVTMVTFVDHELAEFTFKNGEKAKSFYAIEGFSKTKSYYIDFKGTKTDFRIYFMNTVVGPRISFQLPGAEGVYYFGQMVH